MFQYKRNQTLLGSAFTTAELVFHAIVRNIRSQHSNAVLAIVVNIVQMIVVLMVFYLMLTFLSKIGAPVAKIRGEFILYLLTGVFLFMTHNKSVGAISGVGNGNNPMMLHSPINVSIMLVAAAMGVFYTQIISVLVILFVYSVTIAPLEVQDPAGAFMMLLLAWFTGCAVGLFFLALKPWFPRTVGIMNTVYRRLNMVFSGKMFVANALGSTMLVLFSWNPLFHIIDQCRGFVFRNYFPRNTSWEYAIWVGIALTMIGLLAEFYTRQHISQSWEARR